jgi:hypothetical protein
VGVPTSVEFTILNNGPATAADSTLTLAIPDGFEIGAVTPSRGTANISGHTIVVPFGAISGSDGVAVTVQLTPTREAAFTLTGRVSTTTPDGLPGNDSFAIFLRVGSAAPLPPPPPVSPPLVSVLGTRYAVGAGPGGGSHVVVFDGTSPVASFFAYDLGFTGGVSVACGDVTGDGVADIITGAGAGGGPHIKVFDGAKFQEIRSFFAFDLGFAGGVTVAVGDVTGDGIADIVAGAGSSGGPHVKVFDGATGAEVRSFFAYDAGFFGGVRVAVGDLNTDGIADIVTGAGSLGGPHVKAFDGRSGSVLKSFFAFDQGFSGGVNVAVGDVTGDRVPEIVAAAGVSGRPQVNVFDGQTGTTTHTMMVFEESFRGGVNVTVRDLEQDGRADIIVAPRIDGGPRVRAFRGTDFSLLTDSLVFDPSFRGGVFVG